MKSSKKTMKIKIDLILQKDKNGRNGINEQLIIDLINN